MRSKALIVDDIKMNRQMLLEILQDEYEVLQAENGKQAFRMIVTGECGVFSPKLLKCFRMVKKSFERLADSQVAV